jgi:hypothetical protein
VKAMNEADSDKNENRAHRHCAENAPEQNPVLLLLRHNEVVEDNQKKKKIVDAQREFDDVAGDEFQGNLSSPPEKDENGKRHCQAEPHGGSSQRFARARATAPAQNAEIQRQYTQREQIEENPAKQEIKSAIENEQAAEKLFQKSPKLTSAAAAASCPEWLSFRGSCRRQFPDSWG